MGLMTYVIAAGNVHYFSQIMLIELQLLSSARCLTCLCYSQAISTYSFAHGDVAQLNSDRPEYRESYCLALSFGFRL